MSFSSTGVGGSDGAVILVSALQEDNEAIAISVVIRLRIRAGRVDIDLGIIFVGVLIQVGTRAPDYTRRVQSPL
jgi:hypothetical protein